MKLSKKQKLNLELKLNAVFGKVCEDYGIDFTDRPENMSPHEAAYFDGVNDSMEKFKTVINEFFELSK